MDIETALRRHLREVADDQQLSTWVNDEDRMMLAISNLDGSQTLFVAVGDTLLPWPLKPAAQRVATEGFDAHQSMGGV